MTLVLALAVVAAAVNTALARALGLGAFSKLGAGQALVQAAGFSARLGIILGLAHAVWAWRGRPLEVAAFIIAAAVLQLAGQAALILRKTAVAR